MCGRFVSSAPPDEVARYFGAQPPDEAPPPRWNVAPTDDVLAVLERPEGSEHGEGRRLELLRWGLVPPWAPDPKAGNRMFNARAESLATKSAFAPAFKARRCIIPMDGFYEWKAAPAAAKGRKQPVYVQRVDGEPLAVAGLWERWRDRSSPEGGWLLSTTVVTTDANQLMAPVHDRMPVLLPPSAWERWLDPAFDDLDELAGLLVPAPEGLLRLHPVGPEVGNVRSQGPGLVDPVDEDAPPPADPVEQQGLFDLPSA